jgi:branched-subunit amino acid ABC-type transport system permease component
MKMNQQLLQINRNFIICFIISAALSAVVAQYLSEYESHLTATITIGTGYVIYFVIFSILFYFDNKNRYKQMKSSLIRKELVSMISSFGIGEIIFLAIRWPSLYYFLEVGIEPYIASLVSEVISTACYMITVTVFLRKTKTF